MNWRSSIKNSIRAIAGTDKLDDKPDVFLATVDDVDEAARTCSCTLVNGSSDISLDVVNLMAESNDGLLRIPAKGSSVYILSFANGTPWVDVFSEVDKIFYVVGGNTLLMDSTGMYLLGKKYGGIPQVTPSVKAWNDLQNDVNNLKQLFQTLATGPCVTTTPGDPDGFFVLFGATMASYISQQLTVTQQSDIENTHVQHGDNSA